MQIILNWGSHYDLNISLPKFQRISYLADACSLREKADRRSAIDRGRRCSQQPPCEPGPREHSEDSPTDLTSAF